MAKVKDENVTIVLLNSRWAFIEQLLHNVVHTLSEPHLSGDLARLMIEDTGDEIEEISDVCHMLADEIHAQRMAQALPKKDKGQ